MVFSIEESVLSYSKRGVREKWQAQLALENLLVAYREGFHIVVCTPRLADSLRRLLFPNLSNQSTLLRSLASEWPILSAYLGRVSNWVAVVGDEPSPVKSRVGANVILRIPIEAFVPAALSHPLLLLTENLNDSETLSMMAKVYAFRNKLSMLLRFNPTGGGGSTTADQFFKIQQAKERFCLCITDSDRCSPFDAIGSTAARLRSIWDPGSPFCHLMITPCHELENAFSPAMLSRIATHANATTQIPRIAMLETSCPAELIPHLDFKHGVCIRDLIVRFDPRSPSAKFWKDSLTASLSSSAANIDVSCVSNWTCRDAANCSCVLLLGLGENLVRQANRFFEKSTLATISSLIDEHSDPIWMNLGKEVFEWCCGWRSKIT